MKRKSNNYYMLYCLLTITIFLCGCGKGNDTIGGQKGNEIKQDETVYVTQSLSLPEYASFDGAHSDGTDLYYAAAQYDQASQQYDTAFYTLKQGATEPEMNFGLAPNQRVLKMTMDTEGNIYYLGYEEVPEEGDGGQLVSNTMLYKVDQKGTTLLTLDLEEYTREQEQTIIQGLAVDGENRIVLIASNQKVFVLNPDGQLMFETRADGVFLDICSSGGKVFIAQNGIDGVEIREIDISGKKLSAKLVHNISGNQFYMTADRNENLLIATENSVYQYHPESGETVKKCDWNTYDVTGIKAGILLSYGENGVLAISRNYAVVPMKVEATVFREAVQGESTTQEKTMLTLGVLYPIGAGINAEIVYFNKTNPDFKIEVKNYTEDYTRLNADVVAGNCPDLLILPSRETNRFAAKGVLEDLNPYFDGDEALNRSDFMENILNAFEKEGHLYWMPLTFNIITIVGKTSAVGEEPGWNLKELIAFTESASEGTDIFDNTSKSGVLRLLKYAYTNQLVDTDNTGNPLNRELLMKMLTFANQYKNDDRYIYDTNLIGKVREEQVMLLDTVISAGHHYFGCSSLFGEPMTFMGFPTDSGNGHLIQSYYTLAISSGSEHKDIAWNFISTLLSEESQMRMEQDYSTKGFHIRKDALEYHLAWVKENTSGCAIFTLTNDNYAEHKFALGAVKEEDIEPIRDLIRNADTVRMTSPDIDQIIEEEASLYFSGVKPVEEVVDVIENRIRTYVNETN